MKMRKLEGPCAECLFGRPNSHWVKYDDGHLRQFPCVDCMKGMSTSPPTSGEPWKNPPRPLAVKWPHETCASWTEKREGA